MKAKNVRSIGIGLIAMIGIVAFGQSNQSVSSDLAAHKSVLVVGEPLFVKSILRNQGPGVEILYENSPSYLQGSGFGSVMLSGNGTDLIAWSDEMRPLEKVANKVLGQGQSVTNEYVVFFNESKGLAFPRAGKYSVAIRYRMKDGNSVTSQAITVDVRDPEGNDLIMWGKLKHFSIYGTLIQAPWEVDVGTKAFSTLETIWQEPGANIYKQYLGLGIGRCYLARGGDMRTKGVVCLETVVANADASEIKVKAAREIARAAGAHRIK